jgi:hypothetical protein
MKTILYVLTEAERTDFTSKILTHRRVALEHLKEFLKEKDPEEWPDAFSYISEFFSVAYQFELLLEDVALKGEWDKNNQRWVLDEETGLQFVLYTTAIAFCSDELLTHNISLSLH